MILDEISGVIRDRRLNPTAASYVAGLFLKGEDEILKKLGEEAIEVIIASKAGGREQLVHELADLWFHCLVLMEAKGLHHNDIFQELAKRRK